MRASISRTAPSEYSTAGRQRLGGINRTGDERLRQLLDATAVIQYTKPGRPATSPWLLNLLSRKPRKLAAVALANKACRGAGAREEIDFAGLRHSGAVRRAEPGTQEHLHFQYVCGPMFMGSGFAGCARAPE